MLHLWRERAAGMIKQKAHWLWTMGGSRGKTLSAKRQKVSKGGVKVRRVKSFKLKLWLYFVLFTAIVFSVLWLLQTVFLQSFYNAMLIHNTKSAARQIIDNSSQPNINQLIDSLTHDNAFLVYITDAQGNIYYSADEYREEHNRLRPLPDRNIEQDKGDVSFSSDKTEDGLTDALPTEGKLPNDFKGDHRFGGYRPLPAQYSSFLQNLANSESGVVEYSTGSLYVYGTYINYYGEDEPLVLYISVTIDTVGPSVTILSIMLVWVTVLSILIGFVLSWFIAKRFARPVDDLTHKAKHLGGDHYSADYRKGFCSELDELSDTLDTTNEKLHQARSFQMELMANVSHDLRTPLTMIKGYAEMIQDISWEDEVQCHSDLNVIIKEADRLTALVNEILEYSELQTAADTASDFEPVHLSSLVQRTADSFSVLYKPDHLVLEREIQENVHVMGNAGRLERALYNLLDNAVRHTSDTKTVRVILHTEAHRAVIEVTDFGKGIPLGEQEHIWDRYYTSRQRGGKGVSGLGLAIVKQIVTLHKGTCSVRSIEGQGSTFIIDLPLA